MNASYHISLIILSVFSSLGLYFIWRYTLAKMPNKKGKDYGLAFLAGAMAIWALMGMWGLTKETAPKLVFEGVNSLLSSFNSLLCLLSVQYFDYAPTYMRRRRWRQSAIVTCSAIMFLTIAVTAYSYLNKMSLTDIAFVWWPDVLLSCFTILALSIALARSFYYRGYQAVALLSLLAMTLVLSVQLPEVLPEIKNKYEGLENWLTLTSFSLLMMLFFALAASWGVEEFSIPQPHQIHITFEGKENRWWIAQIQVREQKFVVFLPSMALKNLLLFVNNRLSNPQEGWVEIETINGGYVDFRRIVQPIAEAWQEVEGLPQQDKIYMEKVRRVLFDFQNPGQYRLRLDIKNINFNNKLFEQKEELLSAMKSKKEKEEVAAMLERISAWIKNQKPMR